MIQADNDVLEGRARLATIASWAVIAMLGALLVLELGEAGGAIDPLYMSDSMAMLFVGVGAAYTIAFILSVIFVAMWIHRAHANLREAGVDGLEFTPGWAVGWYFIPFANLFKPFQAMRELWNASTGRVDNFGGEAPGEVKLWWGCWIAGNIISNISTRMTSTNDLGMLQFSAILGAISSVIFILCAFLLLRLIREITEGQRQGLGIAVVFQ